MRVAPSVPGQAERLSGPSTDRVLAVVPVLGHHDKTHQVLNDLWREMDLVDVLIVDNGGDYPVIGTEDVLRPGSNLGWAGGTNVGTLERRLPHHSAFVWLNNDTRLSRGFVAGLLGAWRATGAGIVGPFYDCFWRHQRVRRDLDVSRYRARACHFRAPFVDGTCMFVPAATVDLIGVLDADVFRPIGWGADIDYALRARAAGLEVAATRLAYLHHDKSVTGQTVFQGGLPEYAARGFPVLLEGMQQKWGADWRQKAGIDPVTAQTAPLGWRQRMRSGRDHRAAD